MLLLAVVLATGAASAAIPVSERLALIDLYNSTSGAGWTNSTGWKTPPLDVDGFAMPGTECSWFGITCDGAQTTVREVALFANNLVGTLPATLSNLTGLTILVLSSNQLSGAIPSFSANTALQRLYLSSNQLTGAIPSFATNTALWDLTLTSNQLSGAVPSFAANTSLQYLRLGYNQLSGALPSFAANTALVELYSPNNQLSGGIPSFSTNAVLDSLSLSSNQLTGGIPSFSTNTSLRYLVLNGNQLTGAIPSFAANTILDYLLLGDNQLTGAIPSFSANTAMRWLHLQNNRLSGAIPSLAANTALEYLLLNGNQLAGPIDSSLGTLTILGAGGGLDLRWNALSSTDGSLIAFLDSKQVGGDWQSTQTIPVTGLSVTGVLPTQATVNWTPIVYTGDPGNYQVFYSVVSGGPYTPYGTVTADKSATSLTVTGLTPLTPYYFVVQTTTDPHANNQNTVLSGDSAEVATATTPVELMRIEAD